MTRVWVRMLVGREDGFERALGYIVKWTSQDESMGESWCMDEEGRGR